MNAGYQLANNPEYPEISADFQRTFKILKALPCDIFLGAHGNYYGMESKHAKLSSGASSNAVNPFIDPDGYRAYVEDRERAYLNTLNKQKQ